MLISMFMACVRAQFHKHSFYECISVIVLIIDVILTVHRR